MVWANYRLRLRRNRSFMSRPLHMILETGFLTLTVLCLVIMVLLSRNTSQLLVVGFPYATTLSGLLVMQL